MLCFLHAGAGEQTAKAGPFDLVKVAMNPFRKAEASFGRMRSSMLLLVRSRFGLEGVLLQDA